MNLKLIVFSFLISANVFSQEPLLSIKNDLKTRRKAPNEAFAVVDEENKTFAIFLDDDKTLNGYLYSQNLEPLGKFASNGLPKLYTEIIGNTLENGQIRLFLKNQNNRNFGSILFDFDRNASVETEYNFKLDHEIYLQSHSNKNKFYILTVSRRSSQLNVYVFDHGGKFNKKSFDFNDRFFGDRKNNRVKLDEFLTEREQFVTQGAVVKIEETNPNDISITSNSCKIYDRNEKFILTIDGGMLYTYIFEFTVPDLSVNLKAVEKEQFSSDGFTPASNSYLYEDKIYQISGLKDTLVFTVKNIDTKEEIKKISLSKNEEITFKNSPIIQEGTSFFSEEFRELDKTSQFLRKISSEDIGVAVISTNNGYQITMGGNKEITNNYGGPMMSGFGGVIPNVPGTTSFSFNPVFYSFNSYKHNKSIRIECLFDINFVHHGGRVPQNIFDKIKIYTLRHPKARAENLFKMNDYFVYGKYNEETDAYELFKFSE
ncbi:MULTISPECIES: hypothetical protein [Aequorivita]|uniref:6-bladed beta-propeller n=1 Tax=Aequorivita iocasae TaxID=2803865 RepID=A0ABX7DVG3_9FLAO|nr:MULTISPECIES: hypothetical protein [Aequorivita]QQX77552.1 hypothetical protein JK629_04595 [Aequorivita iocasae]UCA57045.1 hypothetical protein LDL78_04620 [Aequorivita sp. F7]